MKRRLRMGMIGGGPGSFIGPVHRLAAELDREIELVAGAFSTDAERSRRAAADYGIDPARGYPDFATMFAAEADRADGIDFVTIAAPNDVHLPAARAAFSAGVPVICDKPATATLREAHEMSDLVEQAGIPFRLTYTYSGYPMVREARARVAAGAIGNVRKVVVEYPQGWLARLETSKQAAWRGDPTQAGEGGCIGDIGVHAFHIAEFVSGLSVTRLLADLGTVVPGRKLDDDCAVLLRFANGARGVLLASQVDIGELNGLRFRIIGDMGALAWHQEQPNSLVLHSIDGAMQVFRAGDSALGKDAQASVRIGGGHPEGYFEAFANLYRDFATLLRGGEAPLLPGIKDGLRGMAFISTAIASSALQSSWADLGIGKNAA